MTAPRHLPDLSAHRREVATPDGPVAVLDIGSGPAVLFLHGVFLSSDLWSPLMAALPAGRRLIAMDLPGHGHSRLSPAVDVDLGYCAALVLDVLDGIGIDRIHLVGNDSGGAIAQLVAARAPERLRSLVLTNCDTVGNLPPPAFAPTVALAKDGRLAGLVRHLRDKPALARGEMGLGPSLQYPDRLTDADLAAFIAPLVATDPAAQQFERFVASLDSDALLAAVDEQLRELAVPTLLIWGTDDVFFGVPWGEELARKIPGCTGMRLVEGGRLFFPMERAAELVAPLLDHWAAADSLGAAHR